MKLLSLTILVLIVGFSQVHNINAQQVLPNSQELVKEVDKLADKDKAEVIKLALELALVKKEIPDYNQIEKQKHILLSTENIKPELVPKIEGIELVLLNPEELEKRAGKAGGVIFYFRFVMFEMKDSKILVHLDNIPMYAENFTERFLVGGGFTVEFEKKSGKWVGVITGSWIA